MRPQTFTDVPSTRKPSSLRLRLQAGADEPRPNIGGIQKNHPNPAQPCANSSKRCIKRAKDFIALRLPKRQPGHPLLPKGPRRLKAAHSVPGAAVRDLRNSSCLFRPAGAIFWRGAEACVFSFERSPGVGHCTTVEDPPDKRAVFDRAIRDRTETLGKELGESALVGKGRRGFDHALEPFRQRKNGIHCWACLRKASKGGPDEAKENRKNCVEGLLSKNHLLSKNGRGKKIISLVAGPLSYP